MRTFRRIGMAVMAIALCFNFAACSDDDDDNAESSGLSGTTWKITSSTEDEEDAEGGYYDYVSVIGTTVKFNSNGTITTSPTQLYEYMHYSMTDGSLKVVMGEGYPDDYTIGTFSVSGNTATYTYHWADCNGEWDETDEILYVATLEKQ